MTATVSVMQPVSIVTSMLASSTAAENDYPVYSSSKSYAVAERCISTATHRIYESLVASNLNKDPTLLANRSGAAPKWLDVGPTNAWAMFDGQGNTQTEAASPLTVVLRPGFINAIYVAGLDADSITMTVKDAPAGNVIFEGTWALEASEPADYDEYFWSRFRPLTDIIRSGIEPFHNCEVTVTMEKASGMVKCGVLAVGDLVPYGQTLSDAEVTPKSYSYIKTNEFGITTIERRNSATNLSISALVDKSEGNNVLRYLRAFQDIPCVYIGSESAEYEGLRAWGLGTGTLKYRSGDKWLLNITVQGFI